MREETLRRLLVAKHLLAANAGQLMPNSDAATVARMVLTAHDAAELAIAAIASELNVPGLQERLSLVDYPAKIEAHTDITFPGGAFVRQLNASRVGFKHNGILPDARDWYRVIDRTWEWVDQWCQAYLKMSINDADLKELLADPEVKALYQAAEDARRRAFYQTALETIGHALYRVLRHFRAIEWPVVGHKSTEDALMLSAFGVRPSEFLALQSLLPRVALDLSTRAVKVEWQKRETGHPGNWTDENVRFCLATLLDLALKVQHAPAVPRALLFAWVFDDVITPKGERADLFEYVFEGHPLLQRVVGRRAVRTLRKDEKLRCHLSPSEIQETPPQLDRILSPKPTIESADVLSVWLEADDIAQVQIMYVERKDVVIDVAVKDKDFVRRACPHLFSNS
jgi:hypothetical protein